ncbi:MAG: hypothetical protein ABI574_16570 [Burkholderiales bacterium]
MRKAIYSTAALAALLAAAGLVGCATESSRTVAVTQVETAAKV